MSDFIVTKEECERGIKGVCEGCGGQLAAIETVDNGNRPTHWQGCLHCSSFRSGVDQKHFRIARSLIENGEMLPYSHMNKCDYEDTPERLAHFFDCQTSGLSRQIQRIDKLLSTYSPPPTPEQTSLSLPTKSGAGSVII